MRRRHTRGSMTKYADTRLSTDLSLENGWLFVPTMDAVAADIG